MLIRQTLRMRLQRKSLTLSQGKIINLFEHPILLHRLIVTVSMFAVMMTMLAKARISIAAMSL